MGRVGSGIVKKVSGVILPGLLFQLVSLLILSSVLLQACGGGGDGGSSQGADIIITGEVLTTDDEDLFYNRSLEVALGGIDPAKAFTQVNLIGANVTLCKATASGIARISDAPTARTSTSSRGYRIITRRQVVSVESNQPLYVCASKPDGSYTLTSVISPDLVSDGATLSINVTPSTTIIGWMLCPGGKFPPSRGPCYTVNKGSVNNLDGAMGSCLSENDWIYNQLWLDDLASETMFFLDGFYPCPNVKDAVNQTAGEYGQAPTNVGDLNTSQGALPHIGDSAGDSAGGGADTVPPSVPCQGTLSGSWSGECCVAGVGCESESGGFSMTIGANGTVTGSYNGSDSGTINGSVGSSCFFTGGGSTSVGSWSGNFTTVGGLSGSGSWSGTSASDFGAASCSGTWGS